MDIRNSPQLSVNSGRNTQMNVDPLGLIDAPLPSGASSTNTNLFNSYAAQFGMNPKRPPTSTNQPGSNPGTNSSIEAYASMMGVKLDNKTGQQAPPLTEPGFSQVQQNAINMEGLLRGNGQSGNVTSMTLPPGIGNGIRPMQMNSGYSYNANANSSMPTNLFFNETQVPTQQLFTKPALPSDLGSQTLDPELLQTMIESNIQGRSSLSSQSHNRSAVSGKMTAETMSKADRSRERNRDHSRKSRLRKKMFVENLKHEVQVLQMYKEIIQECMELVALLSSDEAATFLHASSAFSRILGIDTEKLVAEKKSFFNFVTEADKDKMRNAFNAVIANSGHSEIVLFQMQDPTGNLHQASTSLRKSDSGVIAVTRIQSQ